MLIFHYSGKRTKRGLFVDSKGRKWNADVNASLNIIRKVIGNSIYKDRESIEDSAGNPIRLTV